jgi:hypothetical protein
MSETQQVPPKPKPLLRFFLIWIFFVLLSVNVIFNDKNENGLWNGIVIGVMSGIGVIASGLIYDIFVRAKESRSSTPR